jgi:hypothetical protein
VQAKDLVAGVDRGNTNIMTIAVSMHGKNARATIAQVQQMESITSGLVTTRFTTFAMKPATYGTFT